MTPHEKKTALKYLEMAWEEVNKILTTTECKDCQNMKGGYCNYWKEMVPRDTLVKGCEKWVFDETSPPM